MQLHQFIEQKQVELHQQYRKVELHSQVSVTLHGHGVSEKFTAGATPLEQTGREVKRGEFPTVEGVSMVTAVENGTQVTFNVWGKGKRKPEREYCYFLWD